MAQTTTIRAKGNLTFLLSPLICYAVNYLGRNSRLVSEDNRHCLRVRIERCDPCSIGRRTTLSEHWILRNFHPSETHSFSDLSGGPSEDDNNFVEGVGLLHLVHDPS